MRRRRGRRRRSARAPRERSRLELSVAAGGIEAAVGAAVGREEASARLLLRLDRRAARGRNVEAAGGRSARGLLLRGARVSGLLTAAALLGRGGPAGGRLLCLRGHPPAPLS